MNSWFDGPPTGHTCANCKARPATLWWSGEGGMLAAVRGAVAAWCEICAVREQLKHARERAAAIPGLERRLDELTLDDAATVRR